MKAQAALIASLLVCGCSRQAAELPICTSPLDEAALSEPMQIALAKARIRVDAECAGPGIQCQYGIRSGDSGNIYVKVDYINAEESGRCGQAPGMCAALEYDGQGNFVESGLCI